MTTKRIGIVLVGLALTLVSNVLFAQTHEMSPAELLDKCIKETVKDKVFERVCTTVQARIGGTDWKGSVKSAGARGCIMAIPGYVIAGAPEVTEQICHGGRCGHAPPEFISSAEGVQGVCLDVSAWQEDKPFGGGGHGKFEICVNVEQPLGTDRVIEIVDKCRENLR